jgi:photoactive yellow protein
MNLTFDDPSLPQWLDNHSAEAYDELPFGVVKMNYDGMVTAYGKAQSYLSGVAKENAEGKNFFSQVAPCTNNFMVAEKYNADSLDETLPYIFTYITKPTPVVLRLIKGNNGSQYLLAKNA